MRKIILSAVTITLIAASAPYAFATQPQHYAGRTQQATNAESRDARNAVQQPARQYSGWSAPAGS